MKITLDTDRELDAGELDRLHEVVGALIRSGGLWGVRGGQAILHFDGSGDFMGVQLSYWPWRRRKK